MRGLISRTRVWATPNIAYPEEARSIGVLMPSFLWREQRHFMFWDGEE